MTGLSHTDDAGAARLVDVSGKAATDRSASATGHIRLNSAARDAIASHSVAKGDVLAAARIAGIMAAKRTSELIPLCHPLPLTSVTVDFVTDDEGVAVTANARTTAQTGVEMEALTAATVALLTLYDMLKAVDRNMVIGGVHVVAKLGGKSDFAVAS